MALAFGAKAALPHPFVVPYASSGVPNCGGKFLLRFGSKVVLWDKKIVRVHEWKRLADGVAGAAHNATDIEEFARAIANCRNCTCSAARTNLVVVVMSKITVVCQ
jgi:hypothetical protein